MSEGGREDKVSTVPWYTEAEFQKVFEYLYSSDIHQKKWAYDTISIWEKRCYPTLPAAIEASYVLTSAIIQDIFWTNEASFSQYTDIQAIYGSAVTRFVSLIVEVNKDYSVPAAQIAKGIGIPTYIVELRNEFVHSQRPTLSLLRKAAQDALSYLRVNYWEVEACRLQNHVKRPRTDEFSEIENLLQNYMGLKLEALSRERYGANPNNDNQSELCRIQSSIRYYIKKDKRLFIKVFISDGFFMPDIEDFKQMVSGKEFNDFSSEVNEDVPDDFYTSHPQSVFKHMLPDVPGMHERLWVPVIFELNEVHAVPAFMEALLRSQGDRNIICQKLIIAYILKIWQIHYFTKNIKPCPLKKVFAKKGIVVNWRRMFYSAVVNPCKHTPVILPQLLFRLDWKADLKFRMVNMLAIYLGQVQQEFIKPRMKPRFFTVEELKLAKKKQNSVRMKARGIPEEKSIASRCSDESQKFWPVGCILNTAVNEAEDDSDDENFDEEMEDSESSSNENDNEDTEMIDRSDVTFPKFSEARGIFEMKREMIKRRMKQ